MQIERLFQVCWRCTDGTVLRGTRRLPFHTANEDAAKMTKIDGRLHWAALAREDGDEA